MGCLEIDLVDLFLGVEVDITVRLVLLPTSFLELIKHHVVFLLTMAEKLPLVC